jgi:starch-binding outer membrane protein, SusD/RagB family
VIRFAEVLLTKAEALARLNRLPEAITELNKTRVRAGLAAISATPLPTQTALLDAILAERRLELALEGDRWPDLIRTSRALTVLGIPSNRAFQLLYPIPAREITVSPGLTQNPGY